MKDQNDFQQEVRNIGQRLSELETLADPALRSSARELVQSLMDLHGAVLERMLQITFEFGETGARIIDDLGQDPLVSSLLVLYGLHPDDMQTRVERKLAQGQSRLFKMGAEVTGIVVNNTAIRVQLSIDRHSCGSTAQNVRLSVEELVCEAAPDLTSLVVEGLDEPPASGFVAIEALTGSRQSTAVDVQSVSTMAAGTMDSV